MRTMNLCYVIVLLKWKAFKIFFFKLATIHLYIYFMILRVSNFEHAIVVWIKKISFGFIIEFQKNSKFFFRKIDNGY